jgi:phospholipid/cholesterol/gamma-HCH transport system permease protein
MEDSPPRIERKSLAQAQAVHVLGGWTALQLAQPRAYANLQRQLKTLAQSDTMYWDLRSAQHLDHLGAQCLWNAWGRKWPAHWQAHANQAALLERVARHALAPGPVPAVSLGQAYLKLGRQVLRWLEHARAMLALMGQCLIDVTALLRHPRRAPWRDVSGHLYRIGLTALPITALVGLLIGVVLAYLMAKQLRQLGADLYIVNILGISLIRELGPVLAAVLIAGRSGSAITAQIGVMRVTEEIDAMQVMGIATGYRLVLPRVLAMAVAMPLISVWTTAAALLGGMLAADLVMGVSPRYFLATLPDTLDAANLTLALGKSAVFGVLIAWIGCHYGLRVKPNTESLGQGTTASVVTSITMVILVDALFAVVFRDVGI